jgi:hypothetical protein
MPKILLKDFDYKLFGFLVGINGVFKVRCKGCKNEIYFFENIFNFIFIFRGRILLFKQS